MALSWPQAVIYTVTVEAHNAAGAVSATQTITVTAIAPLTVTVASQPTVTVGVSTSLVAQALPLTTSLPLTYSWQATNQEPLTHTAGISDSVNYRWSTTGPVTVTVRVENLAGVVHRQQLLWVEERRVYLPLVTRP